MATRSPSREGRPEMNRRASAPLLRQSTSKFMRQASGLVGLAKKDPAHMPVDPHVVSKNMLGAIYDELKCPNTGRVSVAELYNVGFCILDKLDKNHDCVLTKEEFVGHLSDAINNNGPRVPRVGRWSCHFSRRFELGTLGEGGRPRGARAARRRSA